MIYAFVITFLVNQNGEVSHLMASEYQMSNYSY